MIQWHSSCFTKATLLYSTLSFETKLSKSEKIRKCDETCFQQSANGVSCPPSAGWHRNLKHSYRAILWNWMMNEVQESKKLLCQTHLIIKLAGDLWSMFPSSIITPFFEQSTIKKQASLADELIQNLFFNGNMQEKLMTWQKLKHLQQSLLLIPTKLETKFIRWKNVWFGISVCGADKNDMTAWFHCVQGKASFCKCCFWWSAPLKEPLLELEMNSLSEEQKMIFEILCRNSWWFEWNQWLASTALHFSAVTVGFHAEQPWHRGCSKWHMTTAEKFNIIGNKKEESKSSDNNAEWAKETKSGYLGWILRQRSQNKKQLQQKAVGDHVRSSDARKDPKISLKERNVKASDHMESS